MQAHYACNNGIPEMCFFELTNATSDQELLDSLAKIIPLLTHVQKEKLLSFGEGMACANSGKDIDFFDNDKKEQK